MEEPYQLFNNQKTKIMNLPKVVADLIDAQNHHDALAYAECFSMDAIVLDEGRTHKGQEEIRSWIEKANREYRTLLKPLKYEETGTVAFLTAEISGTFPGSPAILQYHFRLEDGLIQSLKITG